MMYCSRRHEDDRDHEDDELVVGRGDAAEVDEVLLDQRGEELRIGPKTNWPPYSSRNETPMAVISEAMRGALRSGR